MTEFLQTALTFPTVLYSVLLALCVCYWLLAAIGLLDTDAIDGLLFDDFGTADGAGMLVKFGFNGIPVVLVLTVLLFFGWMTTYFVHLLVLAHLPGLLRWVAGAATALLALLPGLLAASLLLRPLSRFLVKLRPPAPAAILGRAGTVISPQVDATDGRAEFDDGGAGLILQVRAPQGVVFRRGDRVVLLAHDEDAHAYSVISESEFNNR